MDVDLDRAVRDIRTVARAVDRLWDRNVATSGIRADADTIRRTVDEQALTRIVGFLIELDDHGPTYRAAQRLDAVLRRLTPKQKADIKNSLQETA